GHDGHEAGRELLGDRHAQVRRGIRRPLREATMNGKALLLLALAIPSAFAAEEKTHEMSSEARILPGPPRAEWFKADPQYPEPYNAEEQLAIYGGKHLNRTAFPPVDVGLGLYERGAYTPRPTLLGRKNPIMSSFLAYGDLRIAGARNDNGGANGAQS